MNYTFLLFLRQHVNPCSRDSIAARFTFSLNIRLHINVCFLIYSSRSFKRKFAKHPWYIWQLIKNCYYYGLDYVASGPDVLSNRQEYLRVSVSPLTPHK